MSADYVRELVADADDREQLLQFAAQETDLDIHLQDLPAFGATLPTPDGPGLQPPFRVLACKACRRASLPSVGTAALVSCSTCEASYHPSPRCLPVSPVNSMSPSGCGALWLCPGCEHLLEQGQLRPKAVHPALYRGGILPAGEQVLQLQHYRACATNPHSCAAAAKLCTLNGTDAKHLPAMQQREHQYRQRVCQQLVQCFADPQQLPGAAEARVAQLFEGLPPLAAEANAASPAAAAAATGSAAATTAAAAAAAAGAAAAAPAAAAPTARQQQQRVQANGGAGEGGTTEAAGPLLGSKRSASQARFAAAAAAAAAGGSNGGGSSELSPPSKRNCSTQQQVGPLTPPAGAAAAAARRQGGAAQKQAARAATAAAGAAAGAAAAAAIPPGVAGNSGQQAIAARAAGGAARDGRCERGTAAAGAGEQLLVIDLVGDTAQEQGEEASSQPQAAAVAAAAGGAAAPPPAATGAAAAAAAAAAAPPPQPPAPVAAVAAPFQLPDFESVAAAEELMWRLAAHLSLSEQQLDQLDAALQQLPSLEAAAAAGGGTAAGGAATGAGQLSRLQVFRADYARLRARAGCPGASADKVKQAFMLLLQHACRA